MENIQNNNKTNTKKIAGAGIALAAIAGVAGLGFQAMSSWTDSESAGTQLASGAFNIEISTDGGVTWQDETTAEGYAVLDLTDVFDDVEGGTWRPGDSVATDFQIRAADETTHDGVIDASAVDFAVTADDELVGHVSYEISATDFSITGDFASGEAVGEGTLTVPADQTPVEFEAELTASDELPQQANAEGAWTFTATLDN
jgi:hypothetical protein